MPAIHFSTILFDLGNTLIHFDGDWTETAFRAQAAIARSLVRRRFNVDENRFGMAFGKAIQEYNLARRKDFSEPTTRSVLRNSLQEFGVSDVSEKTIGELLKDYYAVSEACWKSSPETLPTLDRLKNLGLNIALISNAADAANVHRQLKSARLGTLFDLVLISAEVGIRKPAREIFQMALDHFHIEPQDAVMVGDTLDADVLGARNAGIPSVWLTRWAHNPQNAANLKRIQPTARIHRLRELPRCLANLK